MKQIIPYIFLSALSALCGCASTDTNRLTALQQEAVAQAMSLVDSGCIRNKYVVLEEFSANDSNSIYRVADQDAPYTPLCEPPFKIIPYKGKFICLIGLRNKAMSIPEVNKIAEYSGNSDVSGKERWLLGVSLGEAKATLFEGEITSMFSEEPVISRPQLWPYYSGYNKHDNSMRVFMGSHNVRVSVDKRTKESDPYEIKSSTLWNDALGLSGEIYFMNNTDSSMWKKRSMSTHLKWR
jgi:hypothetical protein